MHLLWLSKKRQALLYLPDCNSRYAFSDPYIGCMIGVAARNIVCSGGYRWVLPIASTMAILG